MGQDYLSVCPPEVRQGIQSVMDGQSDRWEYEYPCHGPQERRFFRMEVTRTERDGKPYIIVGHVDVTAQRLAELEVRTLNTALVTQTELLSQYTFATTHALQEPLRRLTTTSSALEDLVEGNPRLHRYLRINREAAQEMSALIDSLGHYAAISAQTQEQPQRLNIREVLISVAQQLALEAEVDELPPVLLGYQQGVTLAQNLLKNFRSLLTPGEILRITGKLEGDVVHLHLRLRQLEEFQVKDALRLFQPRGEAALGLSGYLAQQSGGRMWAESGTDNESIGLHLVLPAWREPLAVSG